MKKHLFALACLAAVLMGSGLADPYSASTNILFILDSSGSMWGKVDNVAKITVAKKVLKGILRDLPKDANVGLMAYGHRKKEDCKDVEVLAPIGANDPNKLAQLVAALQPKGKTPLTYSLDQSLPLFATLKGQNNSVVLVSDGKETCGGEPCAAAGKLANAGVDLKVHVVGFDVSAEERKQLECIADKGKGRYFNAENAKGLESALAEVKKEVVRAPPKEKPKPEKPKFKEYFFDDFEGDDLKEHWEVTNPEPDAYLVEKGNLVMIGSAVGGFYNAKNPNIMLLKKELPPGDWMITVKLRGKFQTGCDDFWIGIYDDHKNFIGAELFIYDGISDRILSQYAVKSSNGKVKQIGKDHFALRDRKKFFSAIPQPLYLRLAKQGRKYLAFIRLGDEKDKEGNEVWRESGAAVSLRPPKRIALAASQAKKTGGETIFKVDFIKIEVPDTGPQQQ